VWRWMTRSASHVPGSNQIIQEEGPFAFLYQRMFLHAVRNNVQDLKVGPNPS